MIDTNGWTKERLPHGTLGYQHAMTHTPDVEGMVRDDLYCADWHLRSGVIISVSLQELGDELVEECWLWRKVT